ncbi:MAG: aldolase/citrate lyase family protein, partial [Acidobacteria bacterium]|nr:aldolase/citrate lyase family protein [Acidobacteriota bacterium]
VIVDGRDLHGLQSALSSPADMVIVDGRGIQGPGRPQARWKLAQLCRDARRPSQVIALQIALDSPDVIRNLQGLLLLLKEQVKALILPSVEHPRAIRQAAGLLTTLEREVGLPVGSLALGARITQPETVEREAYAIATASRRMMCLFLDLEAPQPKEHVTDPTTKGFYYYRSALIAATAAADIDAVDGFSNPAQFEEEALFAANLGFHGKLVTPEQAERVNAIMNPQRAGERPLEPRGPAAQAFNVRWINSVERALEILEIYATADQERNLGAVAYADPVTGEREMVDAATARMYHRQLERALKAEQLADADVARYRIIPDRWSSWTSREAAV